jgi:hypothetical protein
MNLCDLRNLKPAEALRFAIRALVVAAAEMTTTAAVTKTTASTKTVSSTPDMTTAAP